MQAINAAITGVHGYVPQDKLSNAELEKMVDTSDEWITTRTGIKERRILKDPDKASAFMGAQAVQGLLQKTHTSPDDIDLVICATITPDYPTPAVANILSNQVGIRNAFSFDLSAACSGFLYALTVGEQFIVSGRYKKVIVVGVDKMSSITNFEDRTTCILFGDGAGAVLLEPNLEGDGIQDSILQSDGAGFESLFVKGGGSLHPATHETIDAKEHFLYQDGRAIFKVAVNTMARVTEEIMKRNDLSKEDIAFLVPHQANKRIIDAVGRQIGLPAEKVMLVIKDYGNTTAATLPLCLWQYESQLKKHDNIILVAFGAGFTWGSTYLKWAYDGK